eukprot:207868-Chlamydomonas_euryale.AAC.1
MEPRPRCKAVLIVETPGETPLVRCFAYSEQDCRKNGKGHPGSAQRRPLSNCTHQTQQSSKPNDD